MRAWAFRNEGYGRGRRRGLSGPRGLWEGGGLVLIRSCELR